MLEVRLLGQFEVLRDRKRLTIPTRNAQSLFAYLILNAGQAHRRERLAGMFWPDSNEENARSNLRHELWRLRKAIETEEESHLTVDELTIAFDPQSEYSLDIHKLEDKALEHGTADELMAALSAYRGELLPGFYDEWVFVERNRLHSLFESRMTRLLELLEAEHRWGEVIDWGMRWISLGSWPEPAYRALISAYASNGDLSKAAATYERYTQVLQKELGIKPSEQTQALYKRIRGGWKPDTQLGSGIFTNKPPITPKSSLVQPVPGSTIRRQNLPKPLTNFIGREKETQQVMRLISSGRLVTITGSGGVGKTRLAIQVADALLPQFEDGVWWVELASLFEISAVKEWEAPGTPALPARLSGHVELEGEDLVLQAVAKVLRIPQLKDTSVLEGIVSYLQDKNLLLVLDNCEHLIEACAALVDRVLSDCHEVSILATSREILGVPGEKSRLLPSLSLPGHGPTSETSDIFKSEAVSLFIERAADVLPGYKPTPPDASVIAQICYRLDGIPLAIELAAARMNLMTAQEIAARLDRRFSLLTGGHRTALPHHQTLWAAIEWSYSLLNKAERTLLRRLSVFAGSFTLEAAEAICASLEIQSDEILTLLGRLVDKSLLTVELAPQDPNLPTRYRFLDTIRSFGLLKLDEAGETKGIYDRQTTYYLRLTETAEPELLGSKQLIWLNRLKDEQNNLRAVLQWSLESNDIDSALQLVGSLWRYWWMQSHHNEGRQWLEKVLSLPGYRSPNLRAKALNGAGILARGQGDFEKASIYLNECLDIQGGLGDKRGMANALNSLGILAHLQGNFSEAIDHYQESREYRREIGDKRGIGASLHNLSMIHEEKGDLDQAEALLTESMALFLEANDTRNIAATQLGLGYIMYARADVFLSKDYFRKSILTLKDLGGRNDIIECLEGFAGVAALLKQPQRGVRLLSAAQAQRDVIGIPVARYQQARYQHIVESIKGQLDSQELEDCSAEGRKMSLEEAIGYALSETE